MYLFEPRLVPTGSSSEVDLTVGFLCAQTQCGDDAEHYQLQGVKGSIDGAVPKTDETEKALERIEEIGWWLRRSAVWKIK